ncbi:MAG TPA: terminase TerL endonuclease subunit [Pelagibacterium sp.]|uniref:terminase large subunit n=1 Tax=Pelagibacterium sp. TaxID=1967288 RepID=UPI002C2A7ADB|nr:terminase TerL endonuclease subunit [Pelagibacterium sp.]HWJ89083.1 terminase TerL endonuclease subunit [Pelagibacterium sp.]
MGSPETRAERNIRWCEEHLRIPEGRFVGQPLKMAEFMKDDFRAIYDNPNGTRRAIISRGRKNAKTTESAMILLLHLCGPEVRHNSQLFSAAQSREQASLLFALAAKMVRMSPTLVQYVVIRDTAKQLFCAELGTLYRALSAEASTAFGLSPILTIHDELGQVKGPRSALYEALETATAAQEEPLSIIISTQAPTDADLLSVLIDDAKTGADPRTVLRFQTAPDEVETFSVDAIRAANPAFDVFMNQQEVLAMAEDAKRMPSRQAEFENLVLNRRVEVNSPFMPRAVWEACGGEPNRDFSGRPVYGGLDLSETTDLTALVLIAPGEDGVWDVRPTFWLPGEGLLERSRSDRVPYDVWAADGKLQTVPGARSIEYDYIAEHLRGVFDDMDVQKIAFDRYNFRHLRPCLLRAGFTEDEIDERFMEFGQGFVSMSPALRQLESWAVNEKLRHGGHPVLNMCAANAVAKMDDAGNRKLTKSQSRGRIDGMVSLAMACGAASEYVEVASSNIGDFVDNMTFYTW